MKGVWIVLCAATVVAGCAGNQDVAENAGAEGELRGGLNSPCTTGYGLLECGDGTECLPLDPSDGRLAAGACSNMVQVNGQVVDANGLSLPNGLHVEYTPAPDNPFPAPDDAHFFTGGGVFMGWLYRERYLVRITAPSLDGGFEQVPWADGHDLDPEGRKVLDLTTADPDSVTPVTLPAVVYQRRIGDCFGQPYDADCTTGDWNQYRQECSEELGHVILVYCD